MNLEVMGGPSRPFAGSAVQCAVSKGKSCISNTAMLCFVSLRCIQRETKRMLVLVLVCLLDQETMRRFVSSDG